jgi:hypothetical protein
MGRVVMGRVAKGRAVMGRAGTGRAKIGRVETGGEKMCQLGMGWSGRGCLEKKLQQTLHLLTGFRLLWAGTYLSDVYTPYTSDK